MRVQIPLSLRNDHASPYYQYYAATIMCYLHCTFIGCCPAFRHDREVVWAWQAGAAVERLRRNFARRADAAAAVTAADSRSRCLAVVRRELGGKKLHFCLKLFCLSSALQTSLAATLKFKVPKPVFKL